MQIACDGKPICGDGLAAAVLADAASSWGGRDGPADMDLGTAVERWTVTLGEVHKSGPVRALLRVRLAGAHSRLDLEFILLRGRAVVDVRARLMWDERGARLRLLMRGVDAATYGAVLLPTERALVNGAYAAPVKTTAYLGEAGNGSLTIAAKSQANVIIPVNGTAAGKLYQFSATVTDATGGVITAETEVKP